jgi:hypothetical protein
MTAPRCGQCGRYYVNEEDARWCEAIHRNVSHNGRVMATERGLTPRQRLDLQKALDAAEERRQKREELASLSEGAP